MSFIRRPRRPGRALIILVVVAVINIFSSHLLAVINNISVWWHVAGAAAVILILVLVPEHHASVGDVFAKTINNSGMFGGATSGFGWLLALILFGAKKVFDAVETQRHHKSRA